MGSITAVRCVACGHENNRQYRYCGMCGAALPQPAPPVAAAPPKAAPPKPVSPSTAPPTRKAPPIAVGGYSILGLEEEPDRSIPGRGTQPRHESSHSVAYLLEDDEDEEKPSRWRLYTALILLAICAGILLRQWQRYGYPEIVLSLASAVRTKIAGEAPPATPSDTTASSEVASTPPETEAASENASEKPSPGKTIAVPPTSETVEPEAAVSNPMAAPAPPAPAASEQTAAAAQSAAPVSAPAAAEAVPSSAASRTSAPQNAAPQSAAPQPKTKQPAPAAETQSASAETPATESPAAPVTARHVSSPIPAADRHLADGMKYLYGNGVEQNCDLAQKNLRRAALSSAEAESLLGTMYASGRCVARDLPTAYRWYARALHRDPSNQRYQSDLVVLWNQMTPAERRLIGGK